MLRFTAITIAALVLSACALQPRIETAADLAAALKRNGVAFTEAQPESFGEMRYAKIDEGLTLTGENLHINILRISDPRAYKVTTSATFILGLVKNVAPEMQQQPPEIYLSEPFAVVIRAEPAEGHVRAALEKIIPEDTVG